MRGRHSNGPRSIRAHLRRGYTDEQLKGIAGLNVLRVIRKAEAVATRLQKEKPPSDVRIEEVDK